MSESSREKLKICCPFFFEISTSRNAPEFARLAYLGRDADFILLTRKTGVVDPYLAERITIHRCPVEFSNLSDDAFYLVNFSIYFIWAMFKVGLLLARGGVDVLYSIQTPDSVICAFYKLLGAKWVIDVLDLPHLYASDLNAQKRSRRSFFPKLRLWLLAFMKRVIGSATAVLTTAFGVDEGFARTLRAECGVSLDKLVLVTNGVNLEFTRPTGIPERDDRFNIFYVGLVSRMRGVNTILTAVSLIRDEIPDVLLTLVGPTRGDDEEWLKGRIAELDLADHVEFTGIQTHEQVLRRMERAHVCVNPVPKKIEHDGTHRIKMFEYLAMGKAVVASRLAGSSRIVTEGENGLLVPPDDPPAWAEAFLRLHDNPGLREKMKNNARPSVERFSLEKVVDRVLETLTCVVRGRSLPPNRAE